MTVKEKFKGAVEFLQMSSNDPSLITQNHNVKVNRDGYVLYGEEDTQFQYLLDMFVNSTTHNAICNSIALLLYGNGLNKENVISADDARKVLKDFYIFGNGALQIVKGQIMHVPVNYLRAREVNSKGVIESFGYSTDWSDAKVEIKDYPNWEVTPNAPISIYYLRPYYPNNFYYAVPQFQGALGYCELEVNIRKFLNNHVKNKFSILKIINFNNGIPDEESRRKITRDVKAKTTGVEADPVMISFNESAETAANIEDIQVDQAQNQYEYVSKEAQDKIIVGHGLTSPLLLGIRDTNGFSSNADEMESAADLFNKMQISPKQEFVADALRRITGDEDIQFIGIDEDVTANDTVVSDSNTDNADIVAKEASYNGAQIASSLDIMAAVAEGTLTQDQAITFLIQMLQFDPAVAKSLFSGGSANQISKLKSQKKGETELDRFIGLGDSEIEGYELFNEGKVEDDEVEDEIGAILDEEFKKKRTLLSDLVELVGTGTARPNAKSSQDREEYIVRYRYKGNKKGERAFCNAMLNADKLYRKEDIQQLKNKPVNPGFGKDGADTYDIWLYKGGGLLSDTFKGGTCKHYWQREIYLKKGTGVDVKNPLAKKISVAEARRKGFRPETNNKKVGTTPHSNYTTRN